MGGGKKELNIDRTSLTLLTTIQNFQKYFGMKHSWQQHTYKIKVHQVLFNQIRLFINYGLDINKIFQIYKCLTIKHLISLWNIFLGYSDERKWFRFLHKSIRRKTVSRVVTFIESKQAQDSWGIN